MRVLAAIAAALVAALFLFAFVPRPGPRPPAPPGETASPPPAPAPVSPVSEAGGEPDRDDADAGPAPAVSGERDGLVLEVGLVNGLTGSPVFSPKFLAWLHEPDLYRRLERDGDLWRVTLPRQKGEFRLRLLAYYTSLFSDPHTGEIETQSTPFARTLRVTHVLWPEAPITVRALDATGRPLPGAVLEGVSFGAEEPERWWDRDRFVETGEDGTAALAGVPRIPGEVVRALVTKGPLRRTGRVVLDRDSPRFEIVISFPPVEEPETEEPPAPEIGIGGGAGGTLRVQRPTETTALRVRVVRHDGSPAAGATVSVRDSYRHHGATADAEGIATVDCLAPGAASVEVRTAGFFSAGPRGVDLPADRTLAIEIREESGRRLAVRVLDHDRTPVRGASIRFGDCDGVPFADVRGNVHVGNHVTDRDGWVVVPRVPEREFRISAHYGSRTAYGRAGPGATVVLELPAHESKRGRHEGRPPR